LQRAYSNAGNHRATPVVPHVEVRPGFAKPDWSYYNTWYAQPASLLAAQALV
jgi:hypothetical protein